MHDETLKYPTSTIPPTLPYPTLEKGKEKGDLYVLGACLEGVDVCAHDPCMLKNINPFSKRFSHHSCSDLA